MGIRRSLVVFLPPLAITLSIVLIIVGAPGARAWGWTTHRSIETNAELVFSAGSFFSSHHSTLYDWCTVPDSDKSFMPDGGGESDWHYLDAYSYNPLSYSGGQLPWAMKWIFDNIVQYLKDEDWDTAAELMGAICHFTGDATMPLHATYDYWLDGMHTTYETAVNNNINQISIPISNYVPQELGNITNAALVTLEESFSFTGNTEDDLSYWLRLGISWNDTIKSITENRVRAGVQFTANVWYTAMIHAGLTIQAPTLTSPSDGSTTTDNTPTFAWTSVSGTQYYDFQLASDNSFTSGVVTVKSRSTTSYALVNPLTCGKWYWRVRTGDNSTDVGLWSQTKWFTVSPSHVEVVISPSYQSGMPGATLPYTLTVKNNENVSDNFFLENTDSIGWNLSLDNNLLAIPAGENRAVTLHVTIPENAIDGTEDIITVTATSQSDNTVNYNASCRAHATILRGVQVVILPPSQENSPSGTLTYTVTVTNTGPSTDTFTLTASDSEDWGPTLSVYSTQLAAGASRQNIRLSITVPSTAAAGDSTTITVTATGTGYDNSATCTATAQAAAGGVSPLVYVVAVVIVVIIAVVSVVKPFCRFRFQPPRAARKGSEISF